MSGRNEWLAEFVGSAMQEGDADSPYVLIEVLKAQSNPLAAFSSRMGDDAVDQAINEAFPFAQWHWRAATQLLPDDVRNICISRLRWLRSALSDWKKTADESRALFAGLLIAARMCAGQDDLWDRLPDAFRPSDEFISEAAAILSRYQLDYDSHGPSAVPIWEGEFVVQFEAHDDAGRWDEIAKAWPRLANAAYPNLYLTELARCLARYDMSALSGATDGQHKVPAVMQILRSLERKRKLQLGMQSTNRRTIFCVMLSALDEAAHRSVPTDDDHTLLVALLNRVVLDEAEWRLWMEAFNRYPVRYPAIQAPLGETLASAPNYAIEAYVDSISLNSFAPRIVGAGGGRQQVSVCLRRFAALACPETRQTLWRLAFNRWGQWRRSPDSHPHGLFEIQWSELDYAVASYGAECLNSSEREGAMTAIRVELAHLDEIWHASLTGYITHANILLSLFQPYGHAVSTPPDGDMLAAQQLYWPFDLEGSPYLRRLLHVNDVAPPI